MLGVEGTEKFYFCPSCKSSHRSYTRDRVKLVVSDSTLHQFFAPPGDIRAQYQGDTLHADYISPSPGDALTSSTMPSDLIRSFFHQISPLMLCL